MTATTSETGTPVLPLILAEVEVRRVERLTPAFVRIELGADALADFGVDGPLYDQRIKLLFPGPHGLPDLNDPALQGPGWWQAWQAMPEETRGCVRTYTIRDVVGTGTDTRIVVDFVLHLAEGATGPGSLWAAEAKIGDRIGLLAPRKGFPYGGIEFAPGVAQRLLLVGDETAVPAVASILEDLPDDAAGKVYLEVPSDGDVLDLRVPAGVQLAWLPRNGARHGERACKAVLALFNLQYDADEQVEVIDPDLWETPTYSSSGEEIEPGSEPAGGLYAWVAGEAAMVTRLRRHLVRDAGLDRKQVAFMGYWRIGVAMKS
ncbi:siderophore-interacting protein [Nocardioides caldifontis]|uniref:siderophore-interacting protein n=1 Tax=Nocardioides caldifontis TaxID=2588938 RepID=UPI0011DF343E|nr:siderophore-interacting protein [Nocardioides caldifontis]